MGRAFEFRKARKMKRWAAMSKAFTRIGKDISIAVKEGGDNPETNSRLRQIIQNAKEINMPKENVDRAIKKASGANAESYIEITLEGYAANGIAVFVECTTDNNNRTVANVRSYFAKFEGALGKNGSLEFIFDRKGVFTIENEHVPSNIEIFEMELIDFGLEDLEQDSEAVTIYCDLNKFSTLQKHFEKNNIKVQNAETQRIPKSTKTLKLNEADLVIKLLEKLEEDEDVQNVFHNMVLTEEILNYMEK